MRFAKRIGYLSVVLLFAVACAGTGEEGAEGAMESGMDDAAATEEMSADSMDHDMMGEDSMMADTTNMMGDSAMNPCAGN